MSKELWFREYEKTFNEFDGEKTGDQIIALTEQRYRDRLADMIDMARLRKKEGEL